MLDLMTWNTGAGLVARSWQVCWMLLCYVRLCFVPILYTQHFSWLAEATMHAQMQHSFVLQHRHCRTVIKRSNNLHLCDMMSSSDHFFANSD